MFEKTSGDNLSVLPVRGPTKCDLWLVGRNSVEELSSVIVFREVCEPRRSIVWLEVSAIEVSDEIFRNTSALGTSWVEGDLQEPDGLILTPHWHLKQIWTFVLSSEISVLGEVGCMGPFLEIRRSEDPNHVVSGVRNDHDPSAGWLVPNDIWITEVVGVDVEHWVTLVGLESVSAVATVGNGLVLSALDTAGVFSERVDLQIRSAVSISVFSK